MWHCWTYPLHWGFSVLWEDGLPGLHGYTAHKPEATEHKRVLAVGSVSSWGSLLGLLVSLLGGLIVMEFRSLVTTACFFLFGVAVALVEG